MKFLKVSKNGTITLPREAQKSFPASSEIALWWKGDALILKRITPIRPSEFAERRPRKGPSLKEIVLEIGKMRKEKKHG
jgi:hypothetical protein